MFDSKSVSNMTHDLSNKLMIIDGYISLMQIDKNNINDDTLQKLADTLACAIKVLIDFKASVIVDDVEKGD